MWRRLACTLTTLAPHAAKLVGKQTVQFYVADGKYRMQVFALEDLQDGHATVYCPDVLGEAEAAGLLAGEAAHAGPHMRVVAASGEPLRVEPLTGESPDAAPHFKDLTGWNRTALRVTLPPDPSPEQVDAAETALRDGRRAFRRPPPARSRRPAGAAVTGRGVPGPR